MANQTTTKIATENIFDTYQPGLDQLNTILSRSTLTKNQIYKLTKSADTKNYLFAVLAVTKNSGNNPKDFIYLLKLAFDLVQQQQNLDPDISQIAKLKIGSLTDSESANLLQKFDEEYPSEQLEDPTNYQNNSYIDQIKGGSDNHASDLYKQFSKSKTGTAAETFATSEPIIATSTEGVVVTGAAADVAATAAPAVVNTSTGLAISTATPAVNIASQPLVTGKILGFSMSPTVASTAVGNELISFGIIQEIPGSVASSSFNIAANSGQKFYQITEKGFRFSASTPKIANTLNYIAQTPGVNVYTAAASTAAKTAATTAASTAAKTAAATGVKALGSGAAAAATGAEVGAVGGLPGVVVGAIAGFIISSIPKILNSIEKYIAPILGGLLVGSGIFGLTGSVAAAATGGIAAGVTTSAVTGGNIGANAGAAAAKFGAITTTITGGLATASLGPLIVGALVAPIIIALILMIINAGAYVLPMSINSSTDCTGAPAQKPNATGIRYSSDKKFAFPVSMGDSISPPVTFYYGCSHWDHGKATDIGIVGHNEAPPTIGVHAPVLAYEAGTVIYMSEKDSLGGKNYILKGSTTGNFYYYAHLCTQYTKVGDSVAAGDVMGTTGNTGNAARTVEHLHFAINDAAYGGNFATLGGDGTICPAQAFKDQLLSNDCGTLALCQ